MERAGTSTAVFGNYPVPRRREDGNGADRTLGQSRDDSWYASWAPATNPRSSVAVLIEHGGFGADAAAPATRDIYNAFFHIYP